MLATRSVKENQAPTTSVGLIIPSTDPDVSSEPFGTLVYSIVDPCPTSFSDVCIFAPAGGLNFNDAKQYCNNEKGGTIATPAQAQAARTSGAVFFF